LSSLQAWFCTDRRRGLAGLGRQERSVGWRRRPLPSRAGPRQGPCPARAGADVPMARTVPAVVGISAWHSPALRQSQARSGRVAGEGRGGCTTPREGSTHSNVGTAARDGVGAALRFTF